MNRCCHGAVVAAGVALIVSVGAATQPAVSIPEFWSEELLHDYELPLATPENTPKHVSRDYYYALPERVVYKSYPIYHPSREPDGYLEQLRAAEPERLFDPAKLTTRPTGLRRAATYSRCQSPTTGRSSLCGRWAIRRGTSGIACR